MKGVMGCRNRHIEESTIEKFYLMAWNEIISNIERIKEKWEQQEAGEDLLQRHKTRVIRVAAENDSERVEMDIDEMISVLDYIMVFEDGTLVAKFYDDSEIKY